MESGTFSDRLIKFAKQNLLILGISCLGVVLLFIGLMQFLGNNRSNEIEFQKGSAVDGAQTSAEARNIVVDVAGEVVKPGVYKLKTDARTQDALIAAGGLSADADHAYIEKSVNLAAPLRDGMKIYIPRLGEAVSSLSTSAVGGSNNNSNSPNSVDSSGMISINYASQSELESLPGVGPVTAGKIINVRPYSSVEELLTKKAVGQSVFNKIKDLISL